MGLVEEGLEVAGEQPAASEAPDPNTTEGFNQILAEKVAPQPDEQSPADVRREVAAPGPSRSVRAGLTFEDPLTPAKRQSPTLPQHLSEGRKLVEAEEAQRAADEQELAVRRFTEAMENAETEADYAAAALRLKQSAPEVYDQMRTQMDVEALDELDDDRVDDVEDSDLPGNRLGSAVERLEAALKVAETRDQIVKLQALRVQQHVGVMKDVYGTSDPDAITAQAELDFSVLRANGVEPTQLSAEDLRGHLVYLHAAGEVHEEELRSIRFKESLLAADSGSVSDGLETVVDGRLVSLQPRPDLSPSAEKIQAKIDAKVAARQKTSRPSADRVREFKASLAEPKSTSWKSGLTQNGRPVDVDLATGERERLRREEAERVARLREFLP